MASISESPSTPVIDKRGTSATQLPASPPLQLNAPDDFAPAWMPRAPHAGHEADTSIPVVQTDEEEPQDFAAAALLAAPPWLVSLLVHMGLILVLGLLVLTGPLTQTLDLNAVFAEKLGDQLDEQTIAIDAEDLPEDLVTPADFTDVADLLQSAPQDLEVSDPVLLQSDLVAPQIGLALSGREPGMKETLLLSFGGNATTEAAVGAALEWLRRNQRSDGDWALNGPYTDGAAQQNKLGATAMALLAFQGAGFSHLSTRPMLDAKGEKVEVDYRSVVRRGWQQMLKWQEKDGNFWIKSGVRHQHHVLYSQAQATIAICELYGMTRDEEFRRPAQRAIDYAVRHQSRTGGWRYKPGGDSDTSVTGWFVMALQSARMAGLDVPSDVFDKISAYLDAVTDDGGSRYGYLPGYGSKLSMTAEALLCRQYMGWPRGDERLLAGVQYLANNPVDWSDSNTYYWYYATQVMHHMEGDLWYDWNRIMAKELPAQQIKEGRERGSWSPVNDRWSVGGRLYMTCLCTYMLEVYYRHLPIYSGLYH